MNENPIKAYRSANKLSKTDLAKMLDVQVSTISRWEAGTRKVRVDRLPLVSKCTGIPIKELRPDMASVMGDAA